MANNPAPRVSTRQPTGFQFNISRDWANAKEFPFEAAFANFLYWHTQQDDTIVTYPLSDDPDIFGMVALYMSRMVVSLGTILARDKLLKAYTTLAYITHPENRHFWTGYAAWPKMMVCVTFASNVADLPNVDAFALLNAQSDKLAARAVRDQQFWQDVEVILVIFVLVVFVFFFLFGV